MKKTECSEKRCLYKAGEIPERPNRKCARCRVAREPARGKDRAKHLGCDYTEASLEQKKAPEKSASKSKASKQKTGKKRANAASTTQTRTSRPRRSRYFEGYDGYYEDVIPVDNGGIRQGVDVNLVKKVSALVAGVLFVVGACVSIMYFL